MCPACSLFELGLQSRDLCFGDGLITLGGHGEWGKCMGHDSQAKNSRSDSTRGLRRSYPHSIEMVLVSSL